MPVPNPPSPSRPTLPPAVRGAAWMIVSGLGFAAMISLVRFLSAEMHPFQIAFFRNLFGLLFMMPWLMRVGIGALGTRRHGLYGLRALFGLAAMLCWFAALAMMPLAEATALSFTAPLFTALAAVIVLGERMGPQRLLAVAGGFVGMLIILRPGLMPVDLAAMLVIASSVFIACAMTTMKILARTEKPSAIVTWMVLYLTPMSLIPALFFWTWPTAALLPWLLALGASATLGQVGMTRAFAAADASVAVPFEYLRLPFVALIGWIAFSEPVDPWTWVGAAVMAGATIFMTLREARNEQKRSRNEMASDPRP